MTSSQRIATLLFLAPIIVGCIPDLPPIAGGTSPGTAGDDATSSTSSTTTSGSGTLVIGSDSTSALPQTGSGDETGASLDFELDGPCINAPAQQLSDFVSTEGLTCTFTGGVGDGRIPNNVALEACEVSGEPLEFYVFEEAAIERFGSWAFVIEVSDGRGASRMVPICVRHDGAPMAPNTLQVMSGNEDVPITAVTSTTFSPAQPVGLDVGAGPAFVIDRVGKSEDIEHAGSIGSFTPAPLSDPTLLVTGDPFFSREATYRLQYPEQALPRGDWNRPFVAVVDLDLCADYATSAACTSFAMYELEIAVSHAVIFEPQPV